MRKTMIQLLAEKDELTRMILSEEEGKLDEYLLEQWRGNELDLKDKIDGYGYVIDNIDAQIESLKQLKSIHTDRLNNGLRRLENEKAKLKSRLWEHANTLGGSLIGNEYRFHPYNGVSRSIDITKLDESEKQYSLPKLSFEQYNKILIGLGELDEHQLKQYIMENVKTSCNVTDLPEGHPAIITEIRHDVRIT